MDIIGNPFGAPPQQQQQQVTGTAAGNPFGASFGEAPIQQIQSQQHQQPNPWGPPLPQQPSNDSSVPSTNQSNPFGAPPAVVQQPTTDYGMPTQMNYQNPYEAQPQNPIPPPTQSSNPFGVPQPSQSAAVVVASNQSNPYALAPSQFNTNPYAIVPSTQPAHSPNPYAFDPSIPSQQYGQAMQQQIVPVNHPYQPWGMAPTPFQQQQMANLDPFSQSAPPAPTPAPAPSASHDDFDLFLQPQQQNQAPPPPPPQPQPDMEPYVVKEEPPPQQPSVAANGHAKDPPVHEGKNTIKEAPNVAAPPEGTMYPPQIQYGHRPDIKPDREPTDVNPRNPYAPVLAREAPPGASPLPKAELVRKRGFALSRISFRTIVMKKWKQTYWVQYGPHTMLWFRSQADFDDWLNNPYHMQTERNFLIKLAVNFVHDLYKPNVRGYQVTQCRTKGYGNKIVRQFKLERWMDYGPTIAAAFGSYDPVEVDTLREAIVECMRNTPLEGGIRATGAVARQPNNPSTQPPRRRQQEKEDDDDDDDDDDEDNGRRSAGNNKTSEITKGEAKSKEPESVSEETDLLDVNNWDDVPLDAQQPMLSNPSQSTGSFTGTDQTAYPGALQTPFGVPPPPPQQQSAQSLPPYYGHVANPYSVPPQQQQQSYPPQPAPYSSALVPVNPAQSYAGAPVPPQQQQQQQQQWMPPPHQTQYQLQPQPQLGGYGMQPEQPYLQQQQQQSDPWATPVPPIQMPPPQY